MEPQGRSVSPLRTRKRSWTLGPSKTTLGSRSGRSNGWAECREKNVGIGPTGRFFLLTFPLIGQCYRPDSQTVESLHPSVQIELCCGNRAFCMNVTTCILQAVAEFSFCTPSALPDSCI